MTDERLPVIWEKGVKTFGDEEMMKMMIQNFEPLSFDGVMKDLSAEFQNENWPEVKRHAHTMKGSSSYIGADRFSEVCLLLQNAAMATDVPEMYDSYEKVLKEGKILKNYLAKLLEKTPDTTEVDSYISALEKLKKTKKVAKPPEKVAKPPEKKEKLPEPWPEKPVPEKPLPDAEDAKKKAASAKNPPNKPKLEENNESKKPINSEKKEKSEKVEKTEKNAEKNDKNNEKPLKKEKENGAPNNSQPVKAPAERPGGILESGEPSADKACCKQCIIF